MEVVSGDNWSYKACKALISANHLVGEYIKHFIQFTGVTTRQKLHALYQTPSCYLNITRYGMVWYDIVEFNVLLDTVQVISEMGTLSSDVHLSFSNGGPAT